MNAVKVKNDGLSKIETKTEYPPELDQSDQFRLLGTQAPVVSVVSVLSSSCSGAETGVEYFVTLLRCSGGCTRRSITTFCLSQRR